MDKNLLAVNKKVPKMGSDRKTMRLLGLTEVASFIARRPNQAGIVRAWLMEMRYQTWATAASLLSDYPNADASHLPDVVFYLGAEGLRIETIVHFPTGIVLLTQIHHPAQMPGYSL